MRKHLIISLVLILLVGSCAPASASSTPTVPPPPPPTTTSLPTITASPTPFVIPTSTPYPPLQTQGPYFLITNDGSNFAILDADLSGRKQIQIPNEGHSWEPEQTVSPDGKWMAYFSSPGDESPESTLNVFNLYDGTSQVVANIVAPGYPENLRPVAETLDLPEYRSECPNIECLTILTSYIFESGIRSIAWSPDSRFLAFAAQIDGPSSDVYLYDLESQTVRRLTNEIENIWQIEWSPTGEKILYDAAVPGPVDPYVYWYMADPKFNSPQRLRINTGTNYYYVTRFGWITEDSYLYAIDTAYYEPVGSGPLFTSVRYINVETNITKEIWRYGAEAISVDPVHGKVMLTTAGMANSQVEAGTYLASLDGSFTKLPDTWYRDIQYLEPFDTFLGTDEGGQLYGVSPAGEVKLPGERPHLSPDKKWVLLWENDRKLNLYSNDFQLVNSWSFDDTSRGGTIWRPDSLGVIIVRSKTFYYYLSIPDGEPRLTMISPSTRNFHTWLP
jgi:WD40 repeat protein